MTYDTTNISNIINNALLPNMLGQNQTAAVNLDSIVEVSKSISNLTADDLKNFKRNLVVGVYNEVISRKYEKRDFKILKDAVTYAGALQRIASAGLMNTTTSHLLNLTNGTSYLDGKYYGANISAHIVERTEAFKIVYSISDDEFSQYFTSKEEVTKFIGLLLETADNSITIEIAELEKQVILKALTNAFDNGRKVQLLTLFNDFIGKEGTSQDPDLTMADILEDRELASYFFDFCKATISKVRSYMADPNKRYNDGTITTWTPSSKLHTIFLNDFIADSEYVGDPIVFHERDFGSFERINAWQNPSTSIIPSFSSVSTIKTVEGSGESAETKTYSNIVGVVYDEDSMGITLVRDKVTVEPVGAEGFTNYHHHLANKYYIDTRFGCVVFTLD